MIKKVLSLMGDTEAWNKLVNSLPWISRATSSVSYCLSARKLRDRI